LKGDRLDGINGYFQDNVVIGSEAMYNVNPGAPAIGNSNSVINNTVIGGQAGYNNSGSNNTIIGYRAGYYCFGNNNVYVGSGAGSNNPNGSDNIFLSTSSDGTTSYSNISPSLSNTFAVYQDNDISTNPLLFGDLTNGRLVINDNEYSTAGGETAGKLFVNGGVEADSYTPFTGVHIIEIYNDEIVEEGQIVVSRGDVRIMNSLNTIVTVEKSKKEKDKRVYGIYAGYEIRNFNNMPTARVDKAAAVGEGTMLVTNVNGNIMNGDYICSSDIPGFGMLQDDDIVHNYTVAKSTEDVDWNNVSDVIVWQGEEYKNT